MLHTRRISSAAFVVSLLGGVGGQARFPRMARMAQRGQVLGKVVAGVAINVIDFRRYRGKVSLKTVLTQRISSQLLRPNLIAPDPLIVEPTFSVLLLVAPRAFDGVAGWCSDDPGG